MEFLFLVRLYTRRRSFACDREYTYEGIHVKEEVRARPRHGVRLEL